MRRLVFSFRPNLENSEHKRAWDILQSVPEGQKNRYLVQAIIRMDDTEHLEKIIRKVIREEVCGNAVYQSKSPSPKEIPDQMMDFLLRMEEDT